MKIAIDCGHTESTAGKRSPDSSLLEYEFNRDVGRQLEAHLKRNGFDTLLIAPTGKDSLTARCKKANDWKADLFISIHANAYSNGWHDANGWGIFICGKGGKAEQLAESIRKVSIPMLGIRDRGVKVEQFTVIAKTNMPAVLVEHAFYTNRAECELLKTPAFREKCAEADARGIVEYCKKKWIPEPKDELEEACEKLYRAGIINSPDYWAKGKGYSDGNVVSLIKKVSQLCKED